jgi:very-short-patch-repair endonuclease
MGKVFCLSYKKKLMRRNRVIDAEFFYGATPEIFFRAYELRKNMTHAENLLWKKLNRKKLLGLTFRRQYPVNQFIADFYCHKARLVIEIDGSIHEIESFKERDIGRDDEFEKFGLLTIRFSNEEVINNIIMVIKKIEQICQLRIAEI